MIVTVRRIPVPDPMAPKKSAKMVNTPIHIPPKVAAVVISALSFLQVPQFVEPLRNIPCYLRFLATSLGPWPEISIQVLENNAQVPITNTAQISVWIGEVMALKMPFGEVMQ